MANRCEQLKIGLFFRVFKVDKTKNFEDNHIKVPKLGLIF